MFNFFKKSNELKGFKVCRNREKSKKYGVAAVSFESLKEKIREKLKIEKFNLYFDKSLIMDEEFFQSIPNQSLIEVVDEGNELKTDYDLLLDVFKNTFGEIFHASDVIKEIIGNNDDVLKAVLQAHEEIHEKTKKSSLEEHPEWFVGIDNKKSKKEEVLRMKARDRIKGYFYKTKDELTKSLIYRSNAKGRKIIDDLLSDFFIFLNGVEYFECLFDRSHAKKFIPKESDEIDARAIVKRRRIDADTKIKIKESNLFDEFSVTLCNDLGYFDCHGSWDANKCSYEHKINPYTSRESLILFQIYNLDHQIEISRSIFPSIIKNVEKLCENKEIICEQHLKPCGELSTITYFQEIFTIENLKLCHIVCHDKGSHSELNSEGKLLCDNCKESKALRKFKRKIS